MDSHPAIAEVAALSPRKAWALPESGLAVFQAGRRCLACFTTFFRTRRSGKAVLCLDGANRFDPLLIARFARQRGQEASAFQSATSRCSGLYLFSIDRILVRVPRLLCDFQADVLTVTALPDLYFDEDVRERGSRCFLPPRSGSIAISERIPACDRGFLRCVFVSHSAPKAFRAPYRASRLMCGDSSSKRTANSPLSEKKPPHVCIAAE